MAEFVKIHFDVRSAQRDIEALPKIARRVTVNTLNKVGRKANTAAKKFITSNYNIKARSMKLGVLVSLRRADARKPNPTFTIFIRKKGRGLFKYGAKALKRGGVTFRVTKARKKLKSAFISIWRRGQAHQFVFRKARGANAGKITRTSSKGTRYEADKRESLFGPSVAQLYNSRRARDVMNKTVRLNFRPMFDEDFRKRMAKRKK